MKLSRRDLLKVLQVGGVTAAGAGLALGGREAAGGTVVEGTCRLCTMHCGIRATCKGDRIVRIEGNLAASSRGFICLHGYAAKELVHAQDRVRRPLKREGDGLREISWEQALGEIGERLARVKAEHGARALAVQTGWPFVRHPLTPFVERFCRAFGSPNFTTAASFCAVAARMGRAVTTGADFHPDFDNAKTLFVWGANPTHTAPLFAHRVHAMGKRGHNLVVIDPVKTEVAAQATEFLQIRPGTDGALALGLLHVIVRDETYDKAFVAEATVGFDALAALVRDYTPERVEALTTVPRAKIERAAQLFAREGPSAIWDCLGVEHHENGTQTVRAMACLVAICGFVDTPGGARLVMRPGPSYASDPLPGVYRAGTPEPVPPPIPDEPIGDREHPAFYVYNRQAQGNLFARAILEGVPYPLRALILFGANAFLTSPSTASLRAAREKLSLLVTVDPFLTETGRQSDYVLPAATFAETAQIDLDGRVGAPELVPPQHESRPDWRILFDLARAAGLEPYFPWASLQEAMAARRFAYVPDPKRTLWPAPRAPDDPPPRFWTISGKVELKSAALERLGLDPLPSWSPSAVQPTAEYPLILVTGPRTRVFINSQLHNAPTVASKLPQPTARLHPSAARRLGVADGQRVAIRSPAGRIELIAELSERVHPEVVVVPCGWAEANANELTGVERRDPISGFPALRSEICAVEPL